jgi:hypothetical protein
MGGKRAAAESREGFEERAAPPARRGRRRVATLRSRLVEVVRGRPIEALGGALALGYLVGRALLRGRGV